MAHLQCKMCGGSVDLPQGVTSGECPYCGCLTTFPKQNDERILQLCTRAEHFRQLNDFDRAMDAYEKIIELDDSDPDVHWGLLLSRFGIEYVEDPATHERIPTCHRVQQQSVLADRDCLAALELSSGSEHDFYETQARKIADIQKQILAISSQEQPYDVFICYKETSEAGTRTRDSKIAQDLYFQLVAQNYKVFFSRITLEDKLGQQYEPYIFSALNSARVMLVIGTAREHFNAVWVKNEWSRFLSLMQEDSTRLLIPCYRYMDPYDLPEELSMFQCQDLEKIGCVQDILRGIGKVITAARDNAHENSASQHDDNTQNLFKRIRFFLFDEDFDSAKQYCWQILDHDPGNLEAYFYQLLAELHMKDENAFPICEPGEAPDESGSAKVILRSQDQKLRDKVLGICRRYRQMPIAQKGVELLAPALKALAQSQDESEDFTLQDTLSVIPHAKTICQALLSFQQAQDVPQAQTMAGHCRELLYQIQRFLAGEEIQRALLDSTANFKETFAELAPILWNTGERTSAVVIRDRKVGMLADMLPKPPNLLYESIANGLLQTIFPLLRDYKDVHQTEADFKARILEVKTRQVDVAMANHDYLSAVILLDPPYLKDFDDLQNTLKKNISACYNRGVTLLKANDCENAKPLFVATARHSFLNSYDLAMYCHKAPERRAKKRQTALTALTIGGIVLGIIVIAVVFGCLSGQ